VSGDANADRIRASLAALNNRDFDTFAAMLAEDMVAFLPQPFPPKLEGKDAYLNEVKLADERADGSMQVHVESILADDDFAMVFVGALADRPGKQQDLRFVLAGELDGDGRYRRLWYVADDASSHAKFWGDEAWSPANAPPSPSSKHTSAEV